MRILILAETGKDAATYARAQGWEGTSWRFVDHFADLTGCAAGSRAPRAVILPGAERHPQHETLRQALEVRGVRWLPVAS